jgi:hypothetical protein
MVRTLLSVHARLMRVQALRQKREAIDGAATADAWALHVAERSMLEVLDADARRLQAALPAATPVAAPVVDVDQRIAEDVSEGEANSQDAALETWLSAQLWKQVSTGSGEMDPRQVVREAAAKWRLANSGSAGRELPANGREGPRMADQGGPINRETASA